VNEGEVRWKIMEPAMRQDFIPYIELIYYQMCEGLHAPLLLYLKNATEASATVMMESVDRLVNGVQRYIKRRIERYCFKPQCGEPVPRLVWGEPKTGLEHMALSDIAQLYGAKGTEGKSALAFNQVQHLLKGFFNDLPDPEEEKAPAPQPFGQKAFGKPAEKPEQDIEKLAERLNDLQTGLSIIAENFHAGKLKVTEAFQMADRVITAHMKRACPETWEQEREKRFREFVKDKLLQLDDKVIHVAVDK
jgi:hypothetical protein